MLIDTHCHLDETAFDDDRDEVLARAKASGVAAMLTIGIDVLSSRAACDLTASMPGVFAVVGVQPNYVTQVDADARDDIVSLLDRPGVVGIGETGLDRYWDYAPLDRQRDWFDWHLNLSLERSLPFVVHCRDADDETIQQLQAFHAGPAGRRPLRGIMHSFCGSRQTAEAALELGMHLSFSGMVTYRRNDELREIAAAVPADRILLETDAPYLAPVPKRGKRNEPALVVHTAAAIAEVRQISPEQLAEQTTQNAVALFGPALGDPPL